MSAKVDLGFRPQSYWDLSFPALAILSAIAGHHRRGLARRLLAFGLAPADVHPGYLTEELVAEQLTPSRRASFKAMSEAFTLGEFLPPLPEGTVEIARQIVRSGGEANVVSIRACRDEDGYIAYTVVDEHDTGFLFTAPWKREPLWLGELVHLLESLLPSDPEVLAALQDPDPDAERLEFELESEFYPHLPLAYGKAAPTYSAYLAAFPVEPPLKKVPTIRCAWCNTTVANHRPAILAHNRACTVQQRDWVAAQWNPPSWTPPAAPSPQPPASNPSIVREPVVPPRTPRTPGPGLGGRKVAAAFKLAERRLGTDFQVYGRGHCRRVALLGPYARVTHPVCKSWRRFSPHGSRSKRYVFPLVIVNEAARILKVDPSVLISSEY